MLRQFFSAIDDALTPARARPPHKRETELRHRLSQQKRRLSSKIDDARVDIEHDTISRHDADDGSHALAGGDDALMQRGHDAHDMAYFGHLPREEAASAPRPSARASSMGHDRSPKARQVPPVLSGSHHLPPLFHRV